MRGLPTNEMRPANEMQKNGHGFGNTVEGALFHPEGFNNNRIEELAFHSAFADQIHLLNEGKVGV